PTSVGLSCLYGLRSCRSPRPWRIYRRRSSMYALVISGIRWWSFELFGRSHFSSVRPSRRIAITKSHSVSHPHGGNHDDARDPRRAVSVSHPRGGNLSHVLERSTKSSVSHPRGGNPAPRF